jgi:hypothetical protein
MATVSRDTYDMFKPHERTRFGDNEANEVRGNDSVRSDLVDIDVLRHHETKDAILVSRDGLEANAGWVPKSLCEIAYGGIGLGKLRNGRPIKLRQLTLTLPEKIAIEKGLR